MLLFLAVVGATLPQIVERLFAIDPNAAALVRLGFFSGVAAFAASLTAWLLLATDMRLLLRKRSAWLVPAALGALALSWLVGGQPVRPMLLMAPILSLLIFLVLPARTPAFDLRPTTSYLLLISILPVAILLSMGNRFDFYYGDSFRGFGQSRTDYSLFAGAAVFLAAAMRSRTKWLFLLALSVGLAMSCSRAAIAALIAALVVLLLAEKIHNGRIWNAQAMALIVAGLVLTPLVLDQYVARKVSFTQLEVTATADVGQEDVRRLGTVKGLSGKGLIVQTVGIANGTDQRWRMIEESARVLQSTWLFGAGNYYQMIKIGAPIEPHNSIFQSLMNFGALTTALWFACVAWLFLRLGPLGKGVLTYWFIFGMFEPGFDAFLFSPESLALLLAAVAMPRLQLHGESWPRAEKPEEGRQVASPDSGTLSEHKA